MGGAAIVCLSLLPKDKCNWATDNYTITDGNKSSQILAAPGGERKEGALFPTADSLLFPALYAELSRKKIVALHQNQDAGLLRCAVQIVLLLATYASRN